MRKLAVAFVAWISTMSTVSAATLIGVSGQVLVNRGGGFQLAQTGMDLKPGDLVVANPGATAQIIYPEGCLAPVTPGAIVSIAAKAPCVAPTETAALPALGLAPLLLGGGAAAGGIGLAAALTKSSDSKPASP